MLPAVTTPKPKRLQANIPSPIAATPKSIKSSASSPAASPAKMPKGRVRIARQEPGVPYGTPMSPGSPATIANISKLKSSVAEVAMEAPSPSSPAVKHWFVGESRRCLAWVMDAEGPVSSMRCEVAWPVPSPAPGEVRIRVVAVGLNVADCIAASKRRPTYPHVLGLDVAGDVDAVGPGVAGFAVGDRVSDTSGSGMHCAVDSIVPLSLPFPFQVYHHGDWHNPYGGFAEYAIGTAVTMRRIPEGMTYEGEGAMI